MKLPQTAGVLKKVSTSRSKPSSAAASTVARHPQRVVLFGAHSYDADDKEVLLIVSKTSKPDGPDPTISSENCSFSEVALICILAIFSLVSSQRVTAAFFFQ